MRSNEKLNRIEDILPDYIRRSSECRERVKIGLRHPYAEGGVFLSESLSGSDRADTFHRLGCSRRINEYILVVFPLTRRRQIIADEFAETELEQAGEEG